MRGWRGTAAGAVESDSQTPFVVLRVRSSLQDRLSARFVGGGMDAVGEWVWQEATATDDVEVVDNACEPDDAVAAQDHELVTVLLLMLTTVAELAAIACQSVRRVVRCPETRAFDVAVRRAPIFVASGMSQLISYRTALLGRIDAFAAGHNVGSDG